MMRASLLFALLLCAGAVAEGEHAKVAINPIRRVVSMLQMMQKKIAAEGDAEKELYEKFMCWCKTGGSALAKSIADAEAKIPEVLKAIEEMEAQMATLKEEVAQHKKDREAAKAAMAEATAVRKKEAAAFAKETAEAKANIAALEKAIAALSKGAYGFLQTSTGAVLKRLVLTVDLGSADRDTLTSFLTEGQGAATEYAPQSGEIIGIMKQMLDTMMASLADAIKAEEEAIKLYKELMAAKAKEIEAATAAIEFLRSSLDRRSEKMRDNSFYRKAMVRAQLAQFDAEHLAALTRGLLELNLIEEGQEAWDSVDRVGRIPPQRQAHQSRQPDRKNPTDAGSEQVAFRALNAGSFPRGDSGD